MIKSSAEKNCKKLKAKKKSFCPVFGLHKQRDISGLAMMDPKMDKDADSMVVKPVEYASSEYSASSEAPPVSSKANKNYSIINAEVSSSTQKT